MAAHAGFFLETQEIVNLLTLIHEKKIVVLRLTVVKVQKLHLRGAAGTKTNT